LRGIEFAQTNYLGQAGLAAGEREKVVFFTKLTAFCPKNNNAPQSWLTVQLAVPLQ